MTTIRTVAIIGAGQMGSGIAQTVAAGGYEVRLYDLSAERIPLAQGEIAASLARRAARGLMTPAEADAALARIQPVASLAEAAQADLVIEAASEDEAVKKSVFVDLLPHLRPDTLLASNTSSISITRLASVSDRPDRFIGLHFMKPAPVMKLVEIVRGIATSAATYEAAVAFAESLGKITTESEDFPAFIVNRILVPMMNEAIYVLYEGVGNVTSIDKALKLGANHPMGPLELADFMGLDVVLAIMNVLYDGLADSKYRPCPLLVKYVEAGWLGKKSGRGFYDYSGATPVPTR
ncbi:3-hydroxybutyryl-CoA dehydrogenase [Brevundimonas sp. NPDC090276]|uniref:3-hydroxybutyryl-CoA dehydrogenase n=1 Tax=Brevundimonas sp. NPDC090276 TaxID=3363956 RepID=UPI00383B4B4F